MATLMMLASLTMIVWANFTIPVTEDCKPTDAWQMTYPPRQVCEMGGETYSIVWQLPTYLTEGEGL
jgi:hypothetical protein